MMQISRLALTPVVLGLAGGLAGAAFSLMTPGVYASSSSVQVQMADPAADAGGLSTLLQTALAETVVDKKAISVSVRPGSVGNLILDVSGSADSAAAARQLTERAAAAIINANLAASERGGTPGGTQSRIVEAANLPLTPRRFTERSALAGAALGAAFGVVVAVATSGRRRKQA